MRSIIALVFALLVLGSAQPPSQLPHTPQANPAAGSAPGDYADIGRDLMRSLAVVLENLAADPAVSTPETDKARVLLAGLPPGARASLLATARRFSAQGESGLRTFYGPAYAPSPSARLGRLPVLAQSLLQRRQLAIRPVRPPGRIMPASLREAALGQRFSAPRETRLRLTLQNLRVNSLNDDNDADEIYLGVWAMPGPPVLQRVPADRYWTFRRGQARDLNVDLHQFGSVRVGESYVVAVSVFEYDDGTWGEIWSAFVQVAQFACETWLQAEIGTLAAALVNMFLEEFWTWIAAWFENPDDFIGCRLIEKDYAVEPRFWAPGPGGTAQVSDQTLAMFTGADANYRLTFRWLLWRQSLRIP